jgi:tRNA pseudouridine55 synthase
VDGVLVVDKPEGPTSHDVVARARRALGVRAVGHTGTLDPMATGVLVLVVGRATRLAQFLSGHRKTYEAVLRLGLVTDTWDRTGTPLPAPGGGLPSLEHLAQVLEGFLGVHLQLPPPYSAKKVEGVRAHVLARRGGVVTIEPASVELHDARLTDADLPLVRLTLHTSAGYYVRALAREIGLALGCGACLENLRRTAIGEFGLAQAVGLDELEQDPHAAARLVPIDALLPDLPSVILDETDARRAAHGNEITIPAGDAGTLDAAAGAVRLVTPDGLLLGIARPTGRPGVLHPAVVLR